MKTPIEKNQFTPRAALKVLLSLGFVLTFLVSMVAAGELFPDLDDSLIPVQDTPKETVQKKIMVAEVGSRQIDFNDVFGIWEPSWRNTMARCQTGVIDEGGADEELQSAWANAIEATIRDEIFRREAILFLVEQVNIRTVKLCDDKGFELQGENSPQYNYIHEQVKTSIYENIEELVESSIQSHTRQVGGKSQLLATLAAQKTTWKEWRERVRRDVIISIYQNESVPFPEETEFTPAEIRNYYRQRAHEFRAPPTIHFRHIYINFNRHGGEPQARSLAAAIIYRLNKNELSFVDAVREYSDDAPSAACEGLDPLPVEMQNTPEALAPARLAWLTKVRDAAEVIPTDTTSPLLLSEVGCHVIKVLSQEEGELLPFAKAQKQITEILAARKRQGQVEEIYQNLRSQAKVQILMPNYPQKYSWSEVQNSSTLRRSINLELGNGN